MPDAWLSDERAALFTDLYQLTMLQAYYEEGLTGEAVFDLTVRTLPEQRNYLVAAGLEDALRYLEELRFSEDALAFLASTGRFAPQFVESLRGVRFEGDVWAVSEGTAVFAGAPLLQVIAPLPQAQLVETFLLNQVHFQTLIASKASRVVRGARGRPVYDFGARRAHGTDAAMKAARAAWIAGVAGTSNVLAGQAYGVPIAGTMAHSYVEAHDDEAEAFARFAGMYPGTTLLVDTYDTLRAVENVIDLVRGKGLEVGAIRLDSGDLGELSRAARSLLDDAGLEGVRIFASGGLDEHEVAALLDAGAPIDAFGVGTEMDTSGDAPRLDCAYKLSQYDGRGRMKLSSGKVSLPGRKQVFRRSQDGAFTGDTVALAGEALEGEPVLEQVMAQGKRTPAGMRTLEEARARCAGQVAGLPEHLRSLDPASPPYPVTVSPALQAAAESLRSRLVQRLQGTP
jgi:nicotinate phosphoribosyltransferase